jgi:hypothetical protein
MQSSTKPLFRFENADELKKKAPVDEENGDLEGQK